MMIELFVDRGESARDIGEIHHPTFALAKRSCNTNFDTKRMAMQARAFVPGREIRQPMGRFDVKDFEDFHDSLAR